MPEPLKIVIIGLGGIGSVLSERLSRFLNYNHEYEVDMLLIDGDEYEPKNQDRQDFLQFGNKAEIKADELSMKFGEIEYDAFPSYINEGNISEVILDGNVVFVCVDNHKSRMIINNYCKNLNNVILISGGNELTDGNAQLYVREGGNDKTPDLCTYHPEIANPDDKLPEEMSCEELSQSEPQLYFTNLGVATLMCWLFYNAFVNKQYDRSEVYFDILTMSADAKIRVTK